jgi:hypothetical protein
MHCGDPANLCARCLDEIFIAARETASARGYAWANDIGSTLADTVEWPTDSEVLLAVARFKVADLGRDPRLLDRLAQELLNAAGARWLAQRQSQSTECATPGTTTPATP